MTNEFMLKTDHWVMSDRERFGKRKKKVRSLFFGKLKKKKEKKVRSNCLIFIIISYLLD